MGVESIGGGYSSGEFPLTPLTNSVTTARQRVTDRRETEYQENIRHRNNIERDAHNQQWNLHNTLLSGAVQGYLGAEKHKQDKALETHKDRLANNTFGKMAKYGQITDYSHGPVSVRFGPAAAAPAQPPAATNKPQPPPVGNALSPQFSNTSAAPQPQGQHPLRPQP